MVAFFMIEVPEQGMGSADTGFTGRLVNHFTHLITFEMQN